MRRRPYDAARLLKWYPASWRARYGDEFVAYVEDTLDGARPKLRFRFSIVLGALRERGRDTGLLGDSVTPSTQSRTGSLLVLCAWSVFILAGATFSKTSEHFARAMPAGSSSLARTGFDVVAVSGALGMVLVAVGARGRGADVHQLRALGWLDHRSSAVLHRARPHVARDRRGGTPLPVGSSPDFVAAQWRRRCLFWCLRSLGHPHSTDDRELGPSRGRVRLEDAVLAASAANRGVARHRGVVCDGHDHLRRGVLVGSDRD